MTRSLQSEGRILERRADAPSVSRNAPHFLGAKVPGDWHHEMTTGGHTRDSSDQVTWHGGFEKVRYGVRSGSGIDLALAFLAVTAIALACINVDSNGHPSDEGASGEQEPAFVCGCPVAVRTGYFHLVSQVQDGVNEITATVDQVAGDVRVELSGLDFGARDVVVDCDAIVISPSAGTLVPVSVTATSTRSILIGGHASLSGEGAFVSIRFSPAGAQGGSGSPTPSGVLMTVPDVLYFGCEFTYPVALNHNDQDPLAYFFDRDRQVVGGVHLASGAVFELANAVEHPELHGALYLVVGRYRTEEDGTLGARLSVSSRPIPASVMSSDTQAPIFNLADTDRDLRLDKFWLQR